MNLAIRGIDFHELERFHCYNDVVIFESVGDAMEIVRNNDIEIAIDMFNAPIEAVSVQLGQRLEQATTNVETVKSEYKYVPSLMVSFWIFVYRETWLIHGREGSILPPALSLMLAIILSALGFFFYEINPPEDLSDLAILVLFTFGLSLLLLQEYLHDHYGKLVAAINNRELALQRKTFFETFFEILKPMLVTEATENPEIAGYIESWLKISPYGYWAIFEMQANGSRYRLMCLRDAKTLGSSHCVYTFDVYALPAHHPALLEEIQQSDYSFNRVREPFPTKNHLLSQELRYLDSRGAKALAGLFKELLP